MSAIILGAAAGGGFPQWNCRCRACQLAWQGDSRVKPRTQASLAVSADGERWALINASPDLRAQIQATPALQPRSMPRDSPIVAVVLTGAEIDQIAGLVTLRESQAFALIATSDTLATIEANPIFNVLGSDMVHRQAVALEEPFALQDGVAVELFAVPGKVALYLEQSQSTFAAEAGVNVGVEIVSGTRRLAYVPGAAAMTTALLQRLARADVVLFDGTLFHDDEMIVTGTGQKTGRRMGHMPLDGAGGTLEQLADLKGRRILTHINNTNPILIEGSPERRIVETAGFEIAEDGMEIGL
ncbi:MAG TPA: pyrroloquinoline quinone biosynthesis protein PqqB [Xanthobacteraceae bacterium]